jgi:hypothetical protein
MEGKMKRWHEDYKITLKEWKKHRHYQIQNNKTWTRDRVGVSAYDGFKYDNEKGRFRKSSTFDCGNPQCFICHSDKYPKRSKTKNELNFNLKYKEQIKDLDDGVDS